MLCVSTPSHKFSFDEVRVGLSFRRETCMCTLCGLPTAERGRPGLSLSAVLVLLAQQNNSRGSGLLTGLLKAGFGLLKAGFVVAFVLTPVWSLVPGQTAAM